jgi:hypothetical protein
VRHGENREKCDPRRECARRGWLEKHRPRSYRISTEPRGAAARGE